MPRVSVLMPVWNGARFLDDALASIVAQDFDDFEVIAVDDGSTDDTPAMLAQWAERDSRIVIVRREENGGAARALNAGLQVARGEYVARMDSDDVTPRGRLAKEVAVLDAHPDVVLVLMTYAHIDARGARLTNPKPAESSAVLAFLNHIAPVVGVPGTSMFRTAAARAIGGWDESFRLSQGWEFFTRLARQGRVIALPDLGLYYRVHPGRMSTRWRDVQLANAVKITRRELTRYLGREVSEEEAQALASVWYAPPFPEAAAVANRLMREAYAKFASDAKPYDASRVRELTAWRFFRGAVMLTLHARPDGAARYLYHAARWRAGW